MTTMNMQQMYKIVAMVLIALILAYIVFDPKVPEYFSQLSQATIETVPSPMNISNQSTKAPVPAPAQAPAKKAEPKTTVPGHSGTQQYASINEKSEMNLPACMNNAAFVSSNLLPKEDSKMETFSEFSPLNMKENFIDSSKFAIGTQSQSLRNANYQLRSDPPNPQKEVCPWMQSTIVPENERRALEIGTKNSASV